MADLFTPDDLAQAQRLIGEASALLEARGWHGSLVTARRHLKAAATAIDAACNLQEAYGGFRPTKENADVR